MPLTTTFFDPRTVTTVAELQAALADIIELANRSPDTIYLEDGRTGSEAFILTLKEHRLTDGSTISDLEIMQADSSEAQAFEAQPLPDHYIQDGGVFYHAGTNIIAGDLSHMVNGDDDLRGAMRARERFLADQLKKEAATYALND